MKTSKDGFLLKGFAMKRWFLIPFLSLTISLQSFAQATPQSTEDDENILLNYEEFSQLTYAEKKTYVKKLREIMVETAKAYPEMAETMSAHSEFYAQLWTFVVASAVGEDSNSNTGGYVPNDDAKMEFLKKFKQYTDSYFKMVESTKTDQMSDEQRGQYVRQYRQLLVWTGMGSAWAHTIQDPAKHKEAFDSINAVKKRVEDDEARVKNAAGAASYEKAKQYMDQAYSGKFSTGSIPNIQNTPEKLIAAGERLPPLSIKADGTVVSSAVAASAPAVVKALPKEEKKTEPAVASKDKKKEVKKKDADPNKDLEREKQKAAEAAHKNAKPEATTTKQEPATESERSDAFYRCMYAGFVIKNHPCMAPSDLPWDLKGLDNAKFKCDKGSVMCNPFLFGFKTACDWSKATDEKGTAACFQDAKPFCVKPGLYATKNCNDNSTSDSAKDAAVHLIDNNREAFNLYSKSFGELCNKQLINFNSYEGQHKPKNMARTKADIKRTCDNARVRMQEIRTRYSLFRTPKKDSPAPPTMPAVKESKGAK
ncbi:MAG: hypothetical protein JSU04_12130 [Bdellovibrionales bacterium]|nr:hypothetical protein [Bdellovibrionales bacterium]